MVEGVEAGVLTFELSYQWDGDDALSDLGYLAQEIERPQRLLQAWRSYRTARFNDQFARNELPDGGTPAPLSRMYAEYKSRKFGNKPIRVASGETRGSYKCALQGNQVVETVNSQAAPYLQSGTSKMPARPVLPTGNLSSQDQNKLVDLAIKFLQQASRR